MELSNQVVNLELSKRLKELGVKKQSLFFWRDNDGFENCNESDFSLQSYINPNITSWYASAYTTYDLFEILPYEINNYQLTICKNISDFEVKYSDAYDERRLHIEFDMSICNALAKMLIHLIENKIVEV